MLTTKNSWPQMVEYKKSVNKAKKDKIKKTTSTRLYW